MKLHGKVIAVTGAGSGIGREVALALLARGARVAAIDLRREGLEQTAELARAGANLSLHTANVADRAAVHALPQAVVAAHGAVDGIINNAGIIHPFETVLDLDYDVIDRVIQVNLYGVIHMVKAFLPHLLDRPEAHITNVSSMGGFMPFPGQTVYGASKAGVKLLTEGLYSELLETSVGVSVVMPGAVATNITGNSGIAGLSPDDAEDAPMKPLPAADAARIVLDGMERDRLHILVGKDAKVMNLASRVAPKWAARFVQKQMKRLLE